MAEPGSDNNSFDFLDDDLVVNEILSRLHCAKTIFRLGMTSKRLSSLCPYSSVLEFRNVKHNDDQLIKYLDEFLDSSVVKKENLILQKNLKRLYLSLSKRTHVPELLDFVSVHVLRWFHKVLSSDIQELILQWNGGPLHTKYSSKRLQLNLQDSMIPLKNLRVLNLKAIPISLNDSFGQWISTYCVGLEELTLFDIVVLPTTLAITSSSLKIFNIEGDFTEFRIVSAPKLVQLQVQWTPINLARAEFHPKIMISNTPNLEFFHLYDSNAFHHSLTYDSSCDDDSKFSVLKCVCVSYVEQLASIKRLLHDISLTKILNIYGHYLHEMSLEGSIQYYANKFKMLEKLAVFINEDGDDGVDEEHKWYNIADASVSFAKSIPILKSFKLTTPNYRYNRQTPLGWLQNALCSDVQELDLQLDISENMHKYNYHDVPKLNLQDSMVSLQNIKILSLQNIPIGLTHSFEDWISTCCTNLEELNLKGVLVIPSRFRIISSSLKVFTIDAHFMDLHVSAPNLVSLRVTWNLVYLGTQETKERKVVSLKVAKYCPHLKEILLSNLRSSLPLEYHSCDENCPCEDYESNFPSLGFTTSLDSKKRPPLDVYSCEDRKSNFPSLEFATLLIPETKNDMSPDSMERLLLDVSPARRLYVSDYILREIFCGGMSVNLINKLEELQVCVEVKRNSKSEVQKYLEDAYQTIVSFVRRVPSLKSLELTIKKHDYDPIVSKTFKESLGEIHLMSGFSRPMVYLDKPPIRMVEIQVCAREDETLLLQHIIKNSPRGWKFLLIYRHN